MERCFIIRIIEEDIPKELNDDLEGHIRGAIGELLNMDADVGFSVVEVEKGGIDNEDTFNN